MSSCSFVANISNHYWRAGKLCLSRLMRPRNLFKFRFRLKKFWQNRHRELYYKHLVPATYHQTIKAYFWPWKMLWIVEWLSSMSVSVCKQLSVLFTKRDRYISVLVNNKTKRLVLAGSWRYWCDMRLRYDYRSCFYKTLLCLSTFRICDRKN